MKIFHVCMLLGFGVVMAPLAAMGSKSKPATDVQEPKVLPESTRPSAAVSEQTPNSAPANNNTPVKLIENTAAANQKVQDEMNTSSGDSDTKANDKPADAKGAKKSSKKNSGKSKKTSSKKSQPKKK